MGILIISSAALITLSALYRSYWSVRARWAYALAWMGSVAIILLWSGSLLYVGVALRWTPNVRQGGRVG